jgi:hypothetical protein
MRDEVTSCLFRRSVSYPLVLKLLAGRLARASKTGAALAQGAAIRRATLGGDRDK